MLRLVEFETERLAAIEQMQNELEAMLPVFEEAADLIRSELEPFRKYGREPHVDVSIKSGFIQLRVTVQKRTAKAVSFNWINGSYRPMSSGGLQFDDGCKGQLIICAAGEIAKQFLGLHKTAILERFERLLPHLKMNLS